ncbi:DNA-directed RNA polymerase core subunit rpc10, partial [Cryomyces antarcticus]
MSREAYQPPTSPSRTAGGASPAHNAASSSTNANAFAVTGGSTYEDTSRPVQYVCGDCDSK